MKITAIAAFSGLVLAAGAPAYAAYDSQTCKAFISGTWTSKPGEDVDALRTTYDVGGTYQQGNESPEAKDGRQSGETGSWDAQPTEDGASCKLMLTPTGSAPRVYALVIVDDNTMRAEDGTVSNRVAGQMEEASPP